MGRMNHRVRPVVALASLVAVAIASGVAISTRHHANAIALPDCGGAGALACGQLFVTPALSGPGGTMGFNQSFLGAHYDPSWKLGAGKVGFCVDEAAGGLAGPGAGPIISLPTGIWTAEQEAQVAWLVTLGQNGTNPYVDLPSTGGELNFGGSAVSTRNRMAAVHIALRDAAPDLGSGRRFEVTGSTGGSATYQSVLAPLAETLANAAAINAVHGKPKVALQWVKGEPRGAGTYRVRLTLTDSLGQPIEYAPVLPTVAGATVAFAGDQTSRPYVNAAATGFPTQDGLGGIPGDHTPGRAGMTDLAGIAEFDITLATNVAGRLELAGTAVNSQVELVEGGVGAQDNVTSAGSQPFLGVVSWNKAFRDVRWMKMIRGIDGRSTAGPAGVIFEVRNTAGVVVATLTTGTDGFTPSVALDDGTYIYREIAVPEGVLLDPTSRTIEVSTTTLTVVVVEVTDAVTPTVQTFIHDLTPGSTEPNIALEGDKIAMVDDATVTGTPGTRVHVRVEFYVTAVGTALCTGTPIASAEGDVVVGDTGSGSLVLDGQAAWTATVGSFTVVAAEQISVPSLGWSAPKRCDSPTEQFALKVLPITRVLERTT
jgi:Prealbumin-like fold domain